MKKILALFISLVSLAGYITLPQTIASAESVDDSYEVVSALGLVPSELDKSVLEAEATRKYLAYAAVKLSGSDAVADSATVSGDTDEFYAPYADTAVRLGFMSYINGNFYPDKRITYTDVKNTVSAAVYGNYKAGTVQIASLMKGAENTSGYITNGQLVKVIYNALSAEIPEMEYKESEINGSLKVSYDSDSKKTLLAKNLEVSVYEGRITEVNAAAQSASVYIEKNKYTTNAQPLTPGTYTMNASGSVNLDHYAHAYSEIWANSDGMILYIKISSRAEVRYGYVYSVNGDDDSTHTYSASYIKNLYFFDDKHNYRTASDFELCWNGEVTDAPAGIIGNFVKAVFYDDKITFIESWELTQGGIITECDKESIRYISGIHYGMRINEVDRYDKKRIFIDNRAGDYNELKTESVFDYYADEFNNLVIVCTEKVISGRFDSIMGDSINVSGNEYYTEDKVYYSTEANRYTDSTKASDLLSRDVDVLFAPSGYVRYIRPFIKGVMPGDKFLAVLLHYSTDRTEYDDDFVVLYTLEPEFERKTFFVDEKVRYTDGLTFDIITGNYITESGSAPDEFIGEFMLNAKGRICEISPIKTIPGFENDVEMTYGNRRKISTDSAQYIETTQNINGQNLPVVAYLKNMPMVFLYIKDGKCEARRVEWVDVKGYMVAENGKSVKLKFIGDGETSKVKMALFRGDTDYLTYYETKVGIIRRIRKVYENDEVRYKINVLGDTGNAEYSVDEATAEGLDRNMLISYGIGMMVGTNQMIVLNKFALDGQKMDDWVFDNSTMGVRMLRKTVKNVDEPMILFDDGGGGFIHHDRSYVVIDNGVDEGFERFTFGTLDDVLPGSRICFYMPDGIRTIIVQK